MIHKLKWVLGSLSFYSLLVLPAFAFPSDVTCVSYSSSLSADFSQWSWVKDASGTYSFQQIYSGLTYIHERPFRKMTLVAEGLSCEPSSYSGFACSNGTTRTVLEQEDGRYTFSLKIEKKNPESSVVERQMFQDLECTL